VRCDRDVTRLKASRYAETEKAPRGGQNAMTRLLEKAFKEAAMLPEVEQNALAKWVLEELHLEFTIESYDKVLARHSTSVLT